jgi:uncharacterized Zn-binding protein involved in type VI secretion
MSGAVRLNDTTTGHDSYPPTKLITSSSNVFVNGRGAVRSDDMIAIHCIRSCHDGSVTIPSRSVFVNGRKKARVGDKITCGDTINSGSANVFIGG